MSRQSARVKKTVLIVKDGVPVRPLIGQEFDVANISQDGETTTVLIDGSHQQIPSETVEILKKKRRKDKGG